MDDPAHKEAEILSCKALQISTLQEDKALSETRYWDQFSITITVRTLILYKGNMTMLTFLLLQRIETLALEMGILSLDGTFWISAADGLWSLREQDAEMLGT